MRRLAILALLTAVPALAQDGADWRGVATAADRARLRDWRTAWIEGLAAASQDERGVALSEDKLLLHPDGALTRPVPPAGMYRCRAIRLGTQRAGQRAMSAEPVVGCEIGDAPLRFSMRGGARRVSGQLYRSTDERAVFLGALAFSGERRPPSYGRVAGRDVAGYVERIGERRWRLVLPRPRFDAVIEVIEIVPAA